MRRGLRGAPHLTAAPNCRASLPRKCSISGALSIKKLAKIDFRL